MPVTKNSVIDTHAHLDMSHFNSDREEAILRAFNTGISVIVNVGIDLDSCRRSVELAEKHEGIYAAVGIHPHDAGAVTREQIAELELIAAHPKVVAIGETGLDFFRDYSPREAQQQVFRWHLELASRLDLPVIIHSRKADADTLTVLREWASGRATERRGVIHCFNGDAVTARKYLEMGFYIAFGAYITYPSSRGISEAVSSIPEERLLVETDCPFLPPQSHRGKRNEPALIHHTVEAIAGMRRTTGDKIAEITTMNAIKLFDLKAC